MPHETTRRAVWRSRPVFISSTFTDMQAERDWLRDRVIPELQERLRERRHHLEPIDLRWGVETVTVAEQQAKELLVLKVCLDEIQRSRPFLIALVGDRYGWVPPEERMRAAVDEQGFRTDVAGKSVTALEIEFGVLDSPDQKRRSLFYFRDPLPYDQMPPETAALYSDAHNPVPGADAAAARLRALKDRIERDPSLAGRVHHYRGAVGRPAAARHGPGAVGPAGAGSTCGGTWTRRPASSPGSRCPVGRTRSAGRWRSSSRTAAAASSAASQITRGAVACRLAIASRRAAWRSLHRGAAAACTGESGSGKSALFAHLYRQLRRPGRRAAAGPRGGNQPAVDPGGCHAAALDRRAGTGLGRRRSAAGNGQRRGGRADVCRAARAGLGQPPGGGLDRRPEPVRADAARAASDVAARAVARQCAADRHDDPGQPVAGPRTTPRCATRVRCRCSIRTKPGTSPWPSAGGTTAR